MIARTVALVFIKAPPGHGRRLTPDTMKTVRPAHLANSFLAPGIVNEVINFQHQRSMPAGISFLKERLRGFSTPPRFSY